MNITLKLYASLGDCLPPGATRNTIGLEVPESTTVGDLLSRQHVPREACHLILINGVFSPPATSDTRQLEDGDTVAIWPPVAGG